MTNNFSEDKLRRTAVMRYAVPERDYDWWWHSHRDNPEVLEFFTGSRKRIWFPLHAKPKTWIERWAERD